MDFGTPVVIGGLAAAVALVVAVVVYRDEVGDFIGGGPGHCEPGQLSYKDPQGEEWCCSIINDGTGSSCRRVSDGFILVR